MLKQDGISTAGSVEGVQLVDLRQISDQLGAVLHMLRVHALR